MALAEAVVKWGIDVDAVLIPTVDMHNAHAAFMQCIVTGIVQTKLHRQQ